MKKTVLDLIAIISQLRDFRTLFFVGTVVIIIHQLALAGVGALSFWISSKVVLDPHQSLTWLFAGLFTIATVHVVGYLLDAWWSHQLAYQVLASMRIDLYKVIERIAPKGMRGRRVADVTAAGMNDMEQLEWFFAHTVSVAVAAVVSPTVLLVILYSIIGPWALLIVVSIICSIGAPTLFANLQRRQGETVRAGLVGLKNLGLESVIGARELHVLGQKENHARRVWEATTRVQNQKLGQAVRKSVENALSGICVTAVSIALLAILTGKVIDGSLNPALLPVAVSLSTAIIIPVNALAGMLGIMGEVSACAARVNALFQTPDPMQNADLDHSHPLGQTANIDECAKHLLKYVKVNFSYDDKEVLRDISLDIAQGRTVAIIGPSGAGKTTLAYLAMRFYDPDSGHISYAGIPLTDVSPDDHRQRLALVPQDGHIFTGTFRSNLVFAKWDATDQELWDSIEAAGMTTLVKNLGGLDATIGDRGTSLSGGEKQRLMLARAFLRQPELLILDEPLANVDPQLEQAINHATGKLRTGRTTIVITHRLSSILIADTVVVVDEGRIINKGTHKELLKDEFYQNLLADQLNL